MSLDILKNIISDFYNVPLIQEKVSLKDKNWFFTGGNASYYVEPSDIDGFIFALDFAKKNNHKVFVLGQGANILINDKDFDGLVIKPQLKYISIKDFDDEYSLITAASGVVFQDLINKCLENNLIGLEEFSGIPGTVGGSVYINIHYFEFLLSQFLHSATVIEKSTGKILMVDNAWFNFGYNNSTLQSKQYYLIDATFKLKNADIFKIAYAKGRRDEIIRHRVKRYPNKGTCGSFFRNFYEDEVTLESGGKKMIHVAYYLDKIGIKGMLRVGDAIVSYQHANMIVNLGAATTTDIITLVRQIQQMVKDQYGIVPKPECQLIGFKEYPLLD